MKPLNGVANCHIEGVFSFVLNEDQRVFATREWTTLGANDFGDVVGFHDHHRDLRIDVLLGEIVNLSASVAHEHSGESHPYPYAKWTWDSTLRGGSGHFIRSHRSLPLRNRFIHTVLTPDTDTFRLDAADLHTIKQLTKVTAWMVTETSASTQQPTVNWSRQDLTNWHSAHPDLYRPLTEKELERVWRTLGLGKLV